MARGQAPVAGETVPCTGQGIVVQSVDAQGRPVKSRGLCPDAALRILAAVELAPPALEVPRASAVLVSWPQENSVVRVRLLAGHSARAPPA